MLKFTPLLLLFLVGCQSGQLIQLEDEEVRVSSPPNMVQLQGNLFMDRSEISNLDWREYLYWLGSVHGKQSAIVQAALPDTTVWVDREGEKILPLVRIYFRHPSYDAYPVVGISHAQALAYYKWRSSRVAEQLLLRAGLLEENLQTAAGGEFDLEKFVAGETAGLVQSGSILVPIFRLPTAEELRLAMDKTYPAIAVTSTFVAQDLEPIVNTVGYKAAAFTAAPQRKGRRKILHLIGNVAEMTTEQGLALGGSWQHELAASLPDQSLSYEGPNSWLGFRNVASWQRISW